MSKVKRIVDKFYKLEEAKALNDKLLSLPTGHKMLNFEKSEEIFKLVNQPRCYYNLEDYVKGSAKYNEILQDREAYEKAQDALKELQHTCVKVVDECHPYTLEVYQHSVVVLEYPEYYSDYDEYDEYAESPVTRVFFTAYSHMSTFSYKERHVVTDFNDLLISYIKDEGKYNQLDLIDDALNTIDHYERKVRAYQLAEKLNTSFNIVCKIFNFRKLKFSEDWDEFFKQEMFLISLGISTNKFKVKYRDNCFYAKRVEASYITQLIFEFIAGAPNKVTLEDVRAFIFDKAGEIHLGEIPGALERLQPLLQVSGETISLNGRGRHASCGYANVIIEAALLLEDTEIVHYMITAKNLEEGSRKLLENYAYYF